MAWWDDEIAQESHRADSAEARERKLEEGLETISKEIRKLQGKSVEEVPVDLQQYVDRAKRSGR